MSFATHIRPHVDHELALALQQRRAGNPAAEFAHLERAHILGQTTTWEHLRTHGAMLAWAWRNRRVGEALGQLTRIAGAAVATPLGKVPIGNTGGANISPFKPLPVPADLQRILDGASVGR